jgi:hypothetical protein
MMVMVARIIKFSELINLLKKNNRNFVGLNFDLICKNSIEDVQDQLELAKFIFDIARHKALEDGFKENYGFNLFTLSRNEIELKGGIGFEEYRMKSIKNHIPGDKNQF